MISGFNIFYTNFIDLQSYLSPKSKGTLPTLFAVFYRFAIIHYQFLVTMSLI